MAAKTIRDTRRQEIARAAGISTGLIYHFFPSKEDILVACCDEGAALHRDLFKRASAIADPLERFDYIVRKLYTGLDKGSKRLTIIYRDVSSLNRESRHHVLFIINELDHLFLELIREGQQKGVFTRDIAHPEILAANVMSLGHQWALQKTWRFAPQIDLETYISAQLTYFHAQLTGKSDV
jgi:AcrR family transcriptional regulator